MTLGNRKRRQELLPSGRKKTRRGDVTRLKKNSDTAPKHKVQDRGFILLPDNNEQLVDFFGEFMEVVNRNVEYYVPTEGGEKKRNFNGKKYVRTFAAYMVYYRFLAPFDCDGSRHEKAADEKIKTVTPKPDGITGRQSLNTIKGLQHPGRIPVILEFIAALDSKFPFLEDYGREKKETPEVFYCSEKFGTTCQTLRTKFKSNPIWFSDGHKFKTSEQKGLPSSWKCYLKALGFPLGHGAYDMKDNEEHDPLVNMRR